MTCQNTHPLFVCIWKDNHIHVCCKSLTDGEYISKEKKKLRGNLATHLLLPVF